MQGLVKKVQASEATDNRNIISAQTRFLFLSAGVSYGLTQDLLRFWKKCGFVPVYLRQTANDLTGEHSAIMLRLIHHQDDDDVDDDEVSESKWLSEFGVDFKRRFVNLLGFDFRKFSPGQFSVVLVFACFASQENLGLVRAAFSSCCIKNDKKKLSQRCSRGIFRLKRA